MDAQFTTRHITSQKSKFEYVVASLSPEYATEVRDLILSPPATNPYDSLRETLIKRTTASEQNSLQQLLHTEELGDHSPSQFLCQIKQLLGDKALSADKSFLREHFLQRLPPHVRMVLASSKDADDLEKLAMLADRVVEVSVPTVSTLNTLEVEQLQAEIASLFNLSQPALPRLRRHTPSPSRPRTDGLCWYHARFAEKANRCQKPCSWSAGNGLAGRQRHRPVPQSPLFCVGACVTSSFPG